MFAEEDLRALTEISAPERAVLSVFLESEKSLLLLDRELKRLSSLVGEGDEKEYFSENVGMVREFLESHEFDSKSLCLFACWALDFFKVIPLPVSVPTLVRVDDSPYIRPLAELQDDYENAAVVVADNKRARIFLVSSAVAQNEEKVVGNVKNHVKVGGWSQQRYERRRDKQVQNYAKDIVSALARLDKEAEFRRIILVGGKETLRAIFDSLPQGLAKRVADKRALDLGRGERFVQEEIWSIFHEEERRSEQLLWERIRTEVLRGGLGSVGLAAVFQAATEGRIEKMVVTRSYRPNGTRCRDCGHLEPAELAKCPACDSTSIFALEMVNEISELLKQSGAEVDFVDPISSLTEAGNIAALLRY